MSSFNEDQVKALKELFTTLDKDGSGAISVTEFETALKDAGIDIPKEEVLAKVKEADKDNSGEIDFKEFMAQIEKNM